MHHTDRITRRSFVPYDERHLAWLPPLRGLDPDTRLAMRAVATVFPFRTNRYVVEQLIDQDQVPADPMFQAVFPQPGMLGPDDLHRLMKLLRTGDVASADAAARDIRRELAPRPGPGSTGRALRAAGQPVPGLFRTPGDAVRWTPPRRRSRPGDRADGFHWLESPGRDDLAFASRMVAPLLAFLRRHPRVTDVTIAGRDPLLLHAKVLRKYLGPLLAPAMAHVATVRLETGAPACWPWRFLTDPDADDLLRLFGDVGAARRRLVVMARYVHPREFGPPAARLALRKIIATGATVRCCTPLMRRVNDDPRCWAQLWTIATALGAVPHDMRIDQPGGPREYFSVPLAAAWEIFHEAQQRVSDLARTIRGPSVGTATGRVNVEGITTILGERVLALSFREARNPEWIGRPFFACLDRRAVRFDQLCPAFRESLPYFGHSRPDPVAGPADGERLFPPPVPPTPPAHAPAWT